MAVDVVVTNYHTDELCNAFVDSYQRERFEGCTITVIDVDRKMDWDMCSSTEPFTRHVGVSHNCGYAWACNRGAADGTNDVILLANADTLLTPGLEECYQALISHSDWGILGPCQVDAQDRITAGGIFGHPQAPMQRGWQETDRGYYDDVREDALYISGSLFFVKRKVWDELTDCKLYQDVQPNSMGAFLETPHYYDDHYCCYHARAHGYQCVYYGPVKMIHYWHAASVHGGWADQQFYRSKQMYQGACAHHNIEFER